MPYVELHAGSAFSFLRGGSAPEHLAGTAAELQMPAVALLDRNGVYGAQRFSVAARENGVRPIVGCELAMEDGAVLPVLVETRTGYKNLCGLLTRAHLRSEKGKCAVQWDELVGFAEGLVTLLGTQSISRSDSGSARFQRADGGILPQSFLSELGNSVRQDAGRCTQDACAPRNSAERARFLIDTFGRSNVFVEIQRHLLRGEERANQSLIDLARAEQLPLLATNGVRYATASGHQVLDVLPAFASTPISMPPANAWHATRNGI